MGGGFFSRGQVYKILANPTYVGEIHHHGKVHTGNHPAIIDRETWERTQQVLEDNRQGQRPAKHARNHSLLAGRLVDDDCEPLIATHACKGKVRYRYYVSRLLQNDPDADRTAGMRIPAREIKSAVAERIGEALDDPIALTAKAGWTLHSGELRQTMALAKALAEQVRAKEYQLVRELVSSVRVRASEFTIKLSAGALAGMLKLEHHDGSHADVVTLVAKGRLRRAGRAVRLVHSNGLAASMGTADPRLVALLVTARRWWERIATGEIDVATLSRGEGINDSWMSRVIRINFLSPRIVEAILDGTHPVNLTARWLRRNDLPLDWDQ